MSARERDHLASRLRLKRAKTRGLPSKEYNLARHIGAGPDYTLDFSRVGRPPETLGDRHRMMDERSLFMHREMAGMIRRKPELFNHARETLARWSDNLKPCMPAALKEWQTILDTKTVDEVLNLICRDDEEGQRLRQSSPFFILPQKRRAAIFKQFELLTRHA